MRAPLARAARRWEHRLVAALGGSQRHRIVLLFASVLGLSSADSGTVGALAAQLEHSFRIGNTRLGLLITVSSLVGAAATLPMGVLADRFRRVPVLVIAIGTWAAAMIATGLAVNYEMLLLTRVALGIVLAAAGPAVASLTGDLFPPGERSRIYSFMLTGELIGSGLGLVAAGDLGALAGWRVAFFALAGPSVLLAIALHRLLPEPRRGGQSRLASDDSGVGTTSTVGPDIRGQVRADPRFQADHQLVLRVDPGALSPWRAARYVLRVRSTRTLIAASALGYFFMAGLNTFAVLYARGRFGLSQGVVSLLILAVGAGAVTGTLLGGRTADRLVGHGRLDGRLLVAGTAFVVAAVVLVPGFLIPGLAFAFPALLLGAAFLTGPNPALDAARLDIMPSGLWGRAESVRTFVRSLLQAFAPLLFGYVSEEMGGTPAGFSAGVNSSHTSLSPGSVHGLELTFLIMLVPLAASGFLLLLTRRRYLVDVATAALSEGSSTTE